MTGLQLLSQVINHPLLMYFLARVNVTLRSWEWDFRVGDCLRRVIPSYQGYCIARTPLRQYVSPGRGCGLQMEEISTPMRLSLC